MCDTHGATYRIFMQVKIPNDVHVFDSFFCLLRFLLDYTVLGPDDYCLRFSECQLRQFHSRVDVVVFSIGLFGLSGTLFSVAKCFCFCCNVLEGFSGGSSSLAITAQWIFIDINFCYIISRGEAKPN